jgi:hypothetical protein
MTHRRIDSSFRDSKLDRLDMAACSPKLASMRGLELALPLLPERMATADADDDAESGGMLRIGGFGVPAPDPAPSLPPSPHRP